MAIELVRSTRRPMLAHLVVTRFCNLDCAYCSEFDKVSKPVPLAELKARIDALARLGTRIVTLTGGEPLTHPDHAEIIAHVRRRGMAATTITNGFLLTAGEIAALNAAGLQAMQISIDGVKPDAVSVKTLKSLRRRLGLLSRLAKFHVNINSVLGVSEERTADALEVAKVAKALGFSHTVGVVHDDSGTLAPLSPTQRRVYDRLLAAGSLAHKFNHLMFQKNLMAGRPNALALPGRGPLPLHLRGGPGALLFAAARRARNPARDLRRGRHRSRVSPREGLRAVLHRQLRPPGERARLLARSATRGLTSQPL